MFVPSLVLVKYSFFICKWLKKTVVTRQVITPAPVVVGACISADVALDQGPGVYAEVVDAAHI
jgi:hypothetical protein